MCQYVLCVWWGLLSENLGHRSHKGGCSQCRTPCVCMLCVYGGDFCQRDWASVASKVGAVSLAS